MEGTISPSQQSQGAENAAIAKKRLAKAVEVIRRQYSLICGEGDLSEMYFVDVNGNGEGAEEPDKQKGTDEPNAEGGNR
jgi:hypothetical protein